MGGEADKFGNRFEGRWTVRNVLDLLLGQVERLTVEAVDEEADSVEFFAVVGGTEQGHQERRAGLSSPQRTDGLRWVRRRGYVY